MVRCRFSDFGGFLAYLLCKHARNDIITDMKVDNYTLADGTPWRLFTPDNAHDGWAVLWLQGFTSTIEGHNDGCERMSVASNVPLLILLQTTVPPKVFSKTVAIGASVPV